MLLTEDQKNFLYNCDQVLSKYGKSTTDCILGRDCSVTTYKDTVIEIIKSDDGYEMEVIRCLEKLPIIWKQNNDYILFHAYYVYLENHLKTLL